MLETMRDPIWNGISAIIAIIALVITVYKDKRDFPSIKKTVIAIGKIFLGTIILFIGPPLEFVVFNILQGGITMAMISWQAVTSPEIIVRNMLSILFSSIFIGSIAISTVSKQNPKKSLLRTMVSTIIAMWVTDLFFVIFYQRVTGSLFFSLFSDILGGFIGGGIIYWAIRIYDNLFESY